MEARADQTAMSRLLRVIIVEDSEADAALLVRTLQQAGYEPDWRRVETAAELNRALDAGVWDVVLADDSLPSFDGFTALAMVQARAADTPFVLVSGTIQEAVGKAAQEAGARDYVLKSDLPRLVSVLARELGTTPAGTASTSTLVGSP